MASIDEESGNRQATGFNTTSPDEEKLKFDGKKKKKSKPMDTDGPTDGDNTFYTYDELLLRCRSLYGVGDNKSDAPKIKISPPILGRIGKNKTVFANFENTCNQLDRQLQHVFAFILAELGTKGSLGKERRMVIHGRFQSRHIETVLKKYTSDYVRCRQCKSTNTELGKSKRLQFLYCFNCKSQYTV